MLLAMKEERFAALMKRFMELLALEPELDLAAVK